MLWRNDLQEPEAPPLTGIESHTICIPVYCAVRRRAGLSGFSISPGLRFVAPHRSVRRGACQVRADVRV